MRSIRADRGPGMAARRALAHRCAERRALCLTFDDGPGPGLTPRLLEVLASLGVRATFFLLGSRAGAHPEVVGAVAAAGHELASHTHEHRNAWKTSPWAAVADVRRGYESLSRWIAPNAMFRPPYGKLTPWTAREVARRGARVGWWTIDSGDTWRQPPAPSAVAEAVETAGGGVVLLHDFDRETPDANERAEHVIAVVRQCVEAARRMGLSVEPLGALLGVTAAAMPRCGEAAERDSVGRSCCCDGRASCGKDAARGRDGGSSVSTGRPAAAEGRRGHGGVV